MKRKLRRMKVSVAAFSVCVLALITNPQLVFGEEHCTLGCTSQCPPKSERDFHCLAKCEAESHCVEDGCGGFMILIACYDDPS